MRLNQFIARHSSLSRRGADTAIENGRIMVNGVRASVGQHIVAADVVSVDGQTIQPDTTTVTIILNKPAGYVCSRAGQGSKTVYELLPPELRNLKPVGRLDKESTGLLLMTNDGELANKLTHPRYQKIKIYEITLDHPLSQQSFQIITKVGVRLKDGLSKFQLNKLIDDLNWQVTMTEGRNRQIRRTFAALGYNVIRLHRTTFGTYQLTDLTLGSWAHVTHNST